MLFCRFGFGGVYCFHFDQIGPDVVVSASGIFDISGEMFAGSVLLEARDAVINVCKNTDRLLSVIRDDDLGDLAM